jgi:uncharacterized protein YbaR (Trm112 family)
MGANKTGELIMIDPEILEMLRCPETRQPLTLADAALVGALNKQIAAGTLLNRGGGKVEAACDGALLRQDGKFAYPIRQQIPVMLIPEALPVGR